MSKYLFHGSYTSEGLKGLMAEGGSKRVEAARQALGSVGGTLEAFYFAFGEADVFVIADLPDTTSALAVSLVTNAAGTQSVRTTPLITPEEMDAAAQKSPSYRPPGR